jgi:aminoglycoside phosphotransferase (APT) family kinase protein
MDEDRSVVETTSDLGLSSASLARLGSYLRDTLGNLDGEFSVRRFTAGHSNQTFLASIGQREMVIKCGPAGQKPSSAHDMGREFGMLSRIHPVYRYAPRALDYCEDASVIGAAFCTMERLHGLILRREYPAAMQADAALIPSLFERLLDGLADLHQIDVDAAGLADFGRPEGYRERQVQGWIKRLEAALTDDLPDFGPIVSWLAQHMPEPAGAKSVVHNDFKLDNLMWREDRPGQLLGVLDWEMATIGDPLMDLACTLSFWVEEADPADFRALRAMPSDRAGVLSRSDAIAYYAARTGRRLDPAEFFLCFGLFRRAVIEQQKYARFLRGQSSDPRYAHLHGAVRTLRDMCLSVIG